MRNIILGMALVMTAGSAQAVTTMPKGKSPESSIVSLKNPMPIILVPQGLPTPPQNVATVPEPSTWALLAAGFGIAGYGLRRRRAAPVAA